MEKSTTPVENPQDPSPAALIATDTPATAPVHQIARQTEHPVPPPNSFKRTQPKESEEPIGNLQAATILSHEGMIGVFYDRLNTTRIPTHIEMNFLNMYTAVRSTLYDVLTQFARLLNTLDNPSIMETIHDTSTQIASGVMVMTYMKLFYVNFDDARLAARLRIKPRVPTPFEVPQPYALAISTLGRIKISGLRDELFLTPAPPAIADTTFGCPDNFQWNPAAYSRAVEYAKKLGLRFSSVDLTVKMGSSWWLFRPTNLNGYFRLDCPYPEENFTNSTAAVALLYCCNEASGLYNPIVDLAALGDLNYGSFIRNPPADVASNAYYAVVEQSELNYMIGEE